jgi:hypothetical protein
MLFMENFGKIVVVFVIGFIVWNLIMDISSNKYLYLNGSNHTTELASKVSHTLDKQIAYFKRTTITFLTTTITSFISFLPVCNNFY